MHCNVEMASTVVERYFHFSNKARTSNAVIYIQLCECPVGIDIFCPVT